MVQIFTLALVLVLSSLASGQSTAKVFSQKKPTPEQLLEQWAEMTGWSDKDASSLVTVWSGYELTGTPGTLKSVFDQSQPGCFLAEVSVPDKKYMSKSGSDGDVGWIYNTVGEENSAEQREVEIMSPQLFIFNELMFNPTWLLSVDKQVRKMVTTGKVMFAGESAWRVLCLPHNSRRSVEVFFSTDTGYWLGSQTKTTNPQRRTIDITMAIMEYGYGGNAKLAAKPGPGYPTHIVVRHGDSVMQDIRVEEFMIKDSIPKAMFELPEAVKLKIEEKTSPLKGRNAAKSAVSASPTGDHARLISMIGSNLVTASGEMVPSSVLAETENVLLYFSAKWCPPCRTFTPRLVKFFDDHAEDKNFTVIFVSSDKSASEMMKYMKDYKMNFYAVPFAHINKSSLKRTYGGSGIPNLVWLNAEDKAVAKSYENGRYVGPQEVLDTFNKSLASN